MKLLCHYVLVATIAMTMRTPAMRANTTLVLWLKNGPSGISQNSCSDQLYMEDSHQSEVTKGAWKARKEGAWYGVPWTWAG